MENKINELINSFNKEIVSVKTKNDLEGIRVSYLGKKGPFKELTELLKKQSNEDKASFGKKINEIKNEINEKISKIKSDLEKEELNKKLENEKIDVTIPSNNFSLGHLHPITRVIDEICEIFSSLGYSVVVGPEIENVSNNFDSLNAPLNHPSRSSSDTFYIKDDILLRTQTSPVQVRELKKSKPPIKVIAPGRCFRVDTPDATHSPMFHQIEGLLVDEGVTLADLKGTLDLFLKKMFSEDVKTKFRPHYFPFTEPSCEVDMTCFKCKGKGCNICKGSGFIEILGCGMVHPNVLKVGNIDTKKYSGFAFGMGVERIAMLKYGIDDIRLFYENDNRFLEQF